jgi:hypothetical protein
VLENDGLRGERGGEERENQGGAHLSSFAIGPAPSL